MAMGLNYVEIILFLCAERKKVSGKTRSRKEAVKMKRDLYTFFVGTVALGVFALFLFDSTIAQGMYYFVFKYFQRSPLFISVHLAKIYSLDYVLKFAPKKQEKQK